MLSKRATQYLSTLQRQTEWVPEMNILIEYLKRQSFPVNEIFLDVQEKYSGYKLTIANQSEHGFLLDLFSKSNISNNIDIQARYFSENEYVFDFGDHDTAQFFFILTNKGEMGVSTFSNEKPVIISSSVEKIIEQYALKNELASLITNRRYYSVLNDVKLDGILKERFDIIEECSDAYSNWCTNCLLTIEKGTWYDKQGFYLHVYGQLQDDCDNFIHELKEAKIID